MLWTIGVILLILWRWMFSGYTLGGVIHVLLVIASLWWRSRLFRAEGGYRNLHPY